MGVRLPAAHAHYFHVKAEEAVLPELRPALAPLLEVIASLTARIRAMGKHIEQLIRERYQEAKLLQQVPGVGPLISLTFILTIGDPHRFKKSRQLGPYLGLVPGGRESGDHSPQLNISKAGNRYLRKLLGERCTVHPRSLRHRYRLEALGPETRIDRWQERQEAGGRRHPENSRSCSTDSG